MRLIIVSNRLPFTVSLRDGLPRFKVSSGGLTTGLWSYGSYTAVRRLLREMCEKCRERPQPELAGQIQVC